MPIENDTLSTKVDTLISLVKELDEISFEKAAIKLDVTVKTIESWSSFLEEEGVISIKYKFTTPYLVYESGGEDTEQEIRALKKEIKSLGNLYFTLRGDIESESKSEINKSFLELSRKTKQVLGELKKTSDYSTKIDYNLISQRYNYFLNLIDHIKLLSTTNDKERIESAHNQMLDELKEIYYTVANGYLSNGERDEINAKFASKADAILDSITGADEIDRNDEDFKQIDALLIETGRTHNFEVVEKKIDNLIAMGRRSEIRYIQDKIKEMVNNLPEEYSGKKTKLGDISFNLNKRVSELVIGDNQKSFLNVQKKIRQIIHKISSDIQNKDYSSADQDYKEAENLFEGLPDGFIDEKIELKNEIIDIHAKLISTEKQEFSHEVMIISKQISDEIVKIKEHIENRDLENAFNGYAKLKEDYTRFPKGFLSEKLKIQVEIFNVYKNILELNKIISEKEVGDKVSEMNSYFKSLDRYISSGKITEAFNLFEQINDIFDTLPEGFFKIKSTVENKILAYSKILSEIEHKGELVKFNKYNIKINELLKLVDVYISRKEYDLAHEAYQEVLYYHDKIPKGFTEKKIQVKQTIMDTYKRLMIHYDSKHLNNLQDYIKKKYLALLKLVVDFHERIEEDEFDTLSVISDEMLKIYNELPLGFVQKNINLRTEVMKVFDEMKLFTYMVELQEKFSKNHKKDLTDELEKIKQMLGDISGLSNEDKNLFSYIQTKIKIVETYQGNTKPSMIIKPVRHNPSVKVKKEKVISKLEVPNRVYKRSREEEKSVNAIMIECLNLFANKKYNESLNKLNGLLDRYKFHAKAYHLRNVIRHITIKGQDINSNVVLKFTEILKIFIKRDKTISDELDLIKIIRAFDYYLDSNKTGMLAQIENISKKNKGYIEAFRVILSSN